MDTNNTQINTFVKGMDTDTSDALISSEAYRYAENLRYVTDGESNSGELHLIDGGSYVGVFKHNEKNVKIDKILGTATSRDYGAVVVVGDFEYQEQQLDPSSSDLYITKIEVKTKKTDSSYEPGDDGPEYTAEYDVTIYFNQILECGIQLGYLPTFTNSLEGQSYGHNILNIPKGDSTYTFSFKSKTGDKNETIKSLYFFLLNKYEYDNVFYQKSPYGSLVSTIQYDNDDPFSRDQFDNKITIDSNTRSIFFSENQNHKNINSISVSKDSDISFALTSGYVLQITNQEPLVPGNRGEVTVAFANGNNPDIMCTFQVIVVDDISNSKLLCYCPVKQTIAYPDVVVDGVTVAFKIHRHSRAWAERNNCAKYCGDYNHMYTIDTLLLKGSYTQDQVYNGTLTEASATFLDQWSYSELEFNHTLQLTNNEVNDRSKAFDLKILRQDLAPTVYLSPEYIDDLNSVTDRVVYTKDRKFARTVDTVGDDLPFYKDPKDINDYSFVTLSYVVDDDATEEYGNGFIESFIVGDKEYTLDGKTINIPLSELTPLANEDKPEGTTNFAYIYAIKIKFRQPKDINGYYWLEGRYSCNTMTEWRWQDSSEVSINAFTEVTADQKKPIEQNLLPRTYENKDFGKEMTIYLYVAASNGNNSGYRELGNDETPIIIDVACGELWCPEPAYATYNTKYFSYTGDEDGMKQQYTIMIVNDTASTKLRGNWDIDWSGEETGVQTGWAIYKITDNKPEPELVFGPCFEPIASQYSHKVSTVLNYENDSTVKLYIADGEHPIMICNIIHKDGDKIYNKLSDITGFAGKHISSINELNTVGGALTSGVVRYTYRLYNARGSISQMSPVSKAISVFTEDIDRDNLLTFKGVHGEQSSVGIQLRIENNGDYDRIQLYRIQFKDGITPSVDLIADQAFNGYLDFVDYPAISLQSYTPEEINRLFAHPKVPEIICAKDNYLFAANVKEVKDQANDAFLQWDARAYSKSSTHNNVAVWDTGTTWTVNNIFQGGDQGGKLQQSVSNALSEIKQSEIIDNVNLSLDTQYNAEDWEIYDDVDNPWIGIGPNVRWKFIIRKGVASEEFDSFPQDRGPLLPINASDISVAYHTDNQETKERITKEITERRKLSLRRDEIYRFGIILYGKDGYVSPVKWIADIRTPDISSTVGNVSGSLFDTYTSDSRFFARPLGIKFKVDNLPTDCVGYEIVRVDRTTNDRATLTQGVVAPTLQTVGDSNTLCSTGLPILSRMYVLNTNHGMNSMPVIIPESGWTDDSDYGKIITYVQGALNKALSQIDDNFEDAVSFRNVPADVNTKTTTDVLQMYTPESLYTQNLLKQRLLSKKIRCRVVAKASIKNEQAGSQYLYACPYIPDNSYEYYPATGAQSYQTQITDHPCVRPGHSHADASNGYLSSANGNLIYDESFAPQLYSEKLRPLGGTSRRRVADALYDNKWLALQGYGKDTWFQYASPAYNYLKYTEIANVQSDIDIISAQTVDDVADGNEFDSCRSVGVTSIGGKVFIPWVVPALLYNEQTTKKRWEKSGDFDGKEFYGDGVRVNDDAGYDDDDEWYDHGRVDWNQTDIDNSIKTVCARFPSGPGSKSILIQPKNIDDNSILAEVYKGTNNNNQISRTLVCNLRQVGIVPYGGRNRQSIDSAVYTKYGDYKEYKRSVPNEIDVFNGDCFINVFEFCTKHKWYHGTYCDTFQASVFSSVILETDIDLDMIYGPSFTQVDVNNGELEASYIQNRSITLTVPNGPTDTRVLSFGTNYMPNQYNAAYSATGSSVLSSAQSTEDSQNVFDTRIFNSSQKKSDELLDSWIDIYSFNFIDVDAKHGAITQMKTVGERLLFWQEDAVGVLSVNERAQVVDSSRNNLLLGSGGVAQRFDYITTQNGMRLHDYSDAVSNAKAYWYDYKRNNICSFGGDGFKQLSKIANINKLLIESRKSNNIVNNPYTSVDHKQNEILFHVLNAGALVFNEQTDRFQSVYTTKPNATISFYDNLYNIYIDNKYTKEKDGHGKDIEVLSSKQTLLDQWNKSNNSVAKTSVDQLKPRLDYVVNKAPSETKVYDNGEIFGKLNVGNGNITMSFSTPLGQYSDMTDARENNVDYLNELYSSAFNVREDKIRFTVPRAKTAHGNVAQYGDRLRGRTIDCSLTSSSNSLNFSIQCIATKYRISWS